MDKVYSKLLSRVQGLSQGNESLSQSGTHPHRLALELAQALSTLVSALGLSSGRLQGCVVLSRRQRAPYLDSNRAS